MGTIRSNGEDRPFACASCYVDFAWAPVERGDFLFCCAGCADSEPCRCTYGEPAQGAPGSEADVDAEHALTEAVETAATGRPGDGVRRDSDTHLPHPASLRGGEVGEFSEAERVMREALAEAAGVLRTAAERMGVKPRPGLGRTIEDLRAPTYLLSVVNPGDALAYMSEVQKLPGVRSAAISGVEPDSARLTVVSESLGGLIEGLLSLTGSFRPRSLSVAGTTVDVELVSGTRLETDDPRFELGADVFFGARHFVVIDGKKGPAHHHSWRVEVTIVSGTQTGDGVVVGFAEARRLLQELVEPYNQKLLNAVSPFDSIQPTAENLARHLYREFKRRFAVESARLQLLRVWESPTNHATYSEAA